MLYLSISLKIRNEEVSEENFLFKNIKKKKVNINYSPFPGDNILSDTKSLPTVPSDISKLRENVNCSAYKMRRNSGKLFKYLGSETASLPRSQFCDR